jgi:cytoskeletal protein RodZ
MPEIPVTEFGARLKQARQARGVSLAQIASVTKISVRSLEAVERNDFSRLPGGIFTRAFVRAYANEVGLDPEVALEQFLAQVPDEVAAVPTGSPESIDGRSPHAEWQEKLTWRHVAVAIGTVALAAAAWYAWSRPPRPLSSSTIGDPPAVQAPVDVPLPSAQGARSQPAALQASSPEPQAPAEARATVAAPTAAASAPAPSAPLVVDMSTTSDCWLFVTTDGTASPSRVYAKGERLSVSARREVIVKAGDAAALVVTINGRPAAPLGGAGRVVTIRLTPDNWASFVAQR